MSNETTTNLRKLNFATFLADAIQIIIGKKRENAPMVATYTVPCTCDDRSCNLQYAVYVVPFTYAAHIKDGTRTIQ